MWAEVWAQQKTHKKRRPQKKKYEGSAKKMKNFYKSAHWKNVGARGKKKIVATVHTFFIKFWCAHNNNTPRRLWSIFKGILTFSDNWLISCLFWLSINFTFKSLMNFLSSIFKGILTTWKLITFLLVQIRIRLRTHYSHVSFFSITKIVKVRHQVSGPASLKLWFESPLPISNSWWVF